MYHHRHGILVNMDDIENDVDVVALYIYIYIYIAGYLFTGFFHIFHTVYTHISTCVKTLKL